MRKPNTYCPNCGERTTDRCDSCEQSFCHDHIPAHWYGGCLGRAGLRRRTTRTNLIASRATRGVQGTNAIARSQWVRGLQ